MSDSEYCWCCTERTGEDDRCEICDACEQCCEGKECK